MNWNIISLDGLDWVDVSGLIYLKMDRVYVHPVSWIKVLFKNIMVLFKNMLS